MNQEEYGEQRHRLWTHTNTIQYYVQKHGQLSVCVCVYVDSSGNLPQFITILTSVQ